MIIAYCYFGLLRSIESTICSHRKFLPEYQNSEIFMHTWYQEKKTLFWHGASKENFHSVMSKIGNLNKQEYKPQILQIERQADIDGKDVIDLGNQKVVWKSGVYLWKTIYSVAKISKDYHEKQNSRIDYYIFLRPDILFKSDLVLDDFIESDSKLGYSRNVNSSGLYMCEDLIFIIKGNQISEFMKYSESMINIQLDLGKNVPPQSPNPLFNFDSNKFDINYKYLVDFEIIRNRSLFKRIYSKIGLSR